MNLAIIMGANIEILVEAEETLVQGWVQWLMPVIPATSALGGRGGWITSSGVQDQLGQYGEILSLLKIQKLAGRSGEHM